MKKLDKLILVIFSLIIFIESIIVIGLVTGIVKVSVVVDLITIFAQKQQNLNILLGVLIFLILLALKGIFFSSSGKKKNSQGILLQNENGKLLITKQTIENIVSSVVNSFESVSDIVTKIETDNINNLIIFINVSVNENVIIKELTLNIQNKVKEAIKRTSDLEVKEVNVNIKNIIAKKETETE